ncbi:hypothetical protein EVAR_100907_1 [Eumeta japonica]|uniref:Uncharacterized protein n=1 Tax=Eumeta variegata TaxID=151549 RepID=A0A4C1T1W8_EUMVA|nr:hypothetical protein EVAR_100907_1 [Eumeta japonica]
MQFLEDVGSIELDNPSLKVTLEKLFRTMMHLLKKLSGWNSSYAGCCIQDGYHFGIIGIAVIGVVATYCIHLLSNGLLRMGVLGASSYHIFVAFVFVINLVKDLKVLTPFSTVSNIFTVSASPFCFLYNETDVQVSEDQLYLKDIQEYLFLLVSLYLRLKQLGDCFIGANLPDGLPAHPVSLGGTHFKQRLRKGGVNNDLFRR